MLYRFPLKSVAGETFPAFPAHAQPAIFKYLVRGPCTRSDHKSASVAGGDQNEKTNKVVCALVAVIASGKNPDKWAPVSCNG